MSTNNETKKSRLFCGTGVSGDWIINDELETGHLRRCHLHP
jgi:hypothetical protein